MLAPLIGIDLSIGMVLVLVPLTFVLAFSLSSLTEWTRCAASCSSRRCPGAIDRMALDLFGNVIPVPLEAAILLAFGALMLWLAIRNFRVVA